MSKPRLIINLDIDTLAHANTMKNNLQVQLVGKDIFETHNFSSGSDGLNNRIFLNADWRFKNLADRNSIWKFITGASTSGTTKNWINTGSLMSRHLCSHDDPEVKDCRTTNYEEFLK